MTNECFFWVYFLSYSEMVLTLLRLIELCLLFFRFLLLFFFVLILIFCVIWNFGLRLALSKFWFVCCCTFTRCIYHLSIIFFFLFLLSLFLCFCWCFHSWSHDGIFVTYMQHISIFETTFCQWSSIPCFDLLTQLLISEEWYLSCINTDSSTQLYN